MSDISRTPSHGIDAQLFGSTGNVTGPSNSSAFSPLAKLDRMPTQPGVYKHKCNYCLSTFSKTEHLKRHERSHTREKPYVCDLCGKKFSRGDSLTRHLRLHDPRSESKFSRIAVRDKDENGKRLERKGKGSRSDRLDDDDDDDDEDDEEEEDDDEDDDDGEDGDEDDEGDDDMTEGVSHRPSHHNGNGNGDGDVNVRNPFDNAGKRSTKKRRTDDPSSSSTVDTLNPLDMIDPSLRDYNPATSTVHTQHGLTIPSIASITSRSYRAPNAHAHAHANANAHAHAGNNQNNGGTDDLYRPLSGRYDNRRGSATSPSGNPISSPSAVNRHYAMYTNALPISYDRGGSPGSSPTSLTSSTANTGIQGSASSHSHSQNPFGTSPATSNAPLGVPRFTPYLSTGAAMDYSSIGPAYIDSPGTENMRESRGRRRSTRQRSVERPAADKTPSWASIASYYDQKGGNGNDSNPRMTTSDSTSRAPFLTGLPSSMQQNSTPSSNPYSSSDAFARGTTQKQAPPPRQHNATESHIRPPTMNLNPALGLSDFSYTNRPPAAEPPSTSSLQVDLGTDASLNNSDFPNINFDDFADLDLLQLLASDTSLAFPHTLIPQFTTYTTVNSPSDGSDGLPPESTDVLAEIRDAVYPGQSISGSKFLASDVNATSLESERLFRKLANIPSHGAPSAVQTDANEEVVDNRMEDAEVTEEIARANATGLPSASTSSKQSKEPNNNQWSGNNEAGSISHSDSVRSQDRAHEAINEAKSLIADLSFSLTAESTPLSSEFLDQCLQLFMNRFLPTFSVIHRPTFMVRTTHAPLLINMMAIGSLFIPTADAKAKGEALWRLVYKGVATSWDRLIDLRNSEYDPSRGIPLVQTILFGTLYASNSSRASIRLAPYTFKGLGFRLARISGMMNKPTSAADDFLPPPNATPAELDSAWRRWAGQETLLRTMLGLYLMDGQLMSMYNCEATVRHLHNPLISVAEDAVFNAPTAVHWKQAVLARATSKYTRSRKKFTFVKMFRHLFHPEVVPEVCLDPDLPAITRAVLIVGLQSAIIDLVEAQGEPYQQPLAREITMAVQRFKAALIAPNSHPLEAVGADMAWQALSMHLIQAQVVEPKPRDGSDTLDGPNYQISFADPDLGWTRTPCGNRMLLHANAIRQQVEAQVNTTTSTPQFYSINFLHTAALIMIAWIKGNRYDQQQLEPYRPKYNLHHLVDWNELGLVGHPNIAEHSRMTISFGSLSSDKDPKSFILTGGQAVLDDRLLNLKDVNIFVEQLRVYGRIWRVANKYAEEITRLIAQSDVSL